MTKQEAIEKLREFCKLRAFCELYPDACQKDNCEIYMAIEVLSSQLDNNSTKVDNENVDLIRRQDAIDIIDVDKMKPEIAPSLGSTAERDFKIYNQSCNKHIELIKQLPSAQPEIIRCKDCLWRIGHDCARFTDLPVYMDDYCGRAKRRGEQDEVN